MHVRGRVKKVPWVHGLQERDQGEPEKIKAIVGILSPHNHHEVQMLASRVAALNRFIALSTDQCLPFFKVLRKAYEWDATCEEAFADLKKYMAHPPFLSQTNLGEDLMVYLAVSPHAISAILV